MICTSFNAHIRKLRVENKEIIWKCKLDDGIVVWSDFDVENIPDPWTRLKQHCKDNGRKVIEVWVGSMGIPEQKVFENPNGIDGFFITRGISKDLFLADTENGITYKYLAFGKLSDSGDKVFVKKFYWPECKFSENFETREVTEDNIALMIFNPPCSENCKCQKKEQI